MTIPFLTGIVGSLILVIGAAWPEKRDIAPTSSLKNWFFLIGGLVMLLYALFGYWQGGSIFFVFLEILICVASVLMMLDTNDVFDTAILSFSGILLVIFSLFLSQKFETIIFVIGLTSISFGYAFKMQTIRREAALTLGGVLIAIFSYLVANWIFFGLNFIFALFSLWYWIKAEKKN